MSKTVYECAKYWRLKDVLVSPTFRQGKSLTDEVEMGIKESDESSILESFCDKENLPTLKEVREIFSR